MEVTTNSTEELKRLAQQIAQKLSPGDVVALYGDLGAGKTTFTRFLVSALGINVRVQSPTFVIMRRYEDDFSEKEIGVVNHIDLYRLTSPEELLDLGLADIFAEPNSISVIEWPDLAEGLLPEHTLRLHFEYLDDIARKISIS